MAEQLRFVIGCADRDIGSAGLLFECRKTSGVDDAIAVKQRLQKAVTAWVKETKEGREIYDSINGDFNVGDFFEHMETPSLVGRLEDNGLFDLHLENLGPPLAECWDHDDLLVNALDLEPHDDERTITHT